jgi:hypothetical protein
MIYDLSNLLDQKKACTILRKHIEDEVKIEIKLIRKKRTVKQNAYLHVCISLYSANLGYTESEGKSLLKKMCPFMNYEKNGQTFYKESRDLDTKEMTDFIEWIRNHSASIGNYIPSAEEYLENKYHIDKEIEINRKFL